MRAVFCALLLTLGAGCAESQLVSTPDMGTGVMSTVPDIDVIGTWSTCRRTVTFAPGGVARLDLLADGCASEGTYVVSGDHVDVAWPDDGCAGAPWHYRGLRTENSLTLVNTETGGGTSYARYAPAFWELRATDGSNRATIVEIISPGPGQISGCYWSADHACGGLFSCGGSIGSWVLDDRMLHATSSCLGECPCGTVMDATSDGNGGYAGTFEGANCDDMFGGGFTMAPVQLP